MTKKCQQCNKEFKKAYADSKNYFLNRRKYCSKECYGATLLNHIPWNKGLKGFRAGSLSHFWKGGRPKCKLCGNLCVAYKAKICGTCQQKGGANQSQWKGGTTAVLNAIRNSLQSKTRKWRKLVLQRDNYTCKMPDCDGTDSRLEVNHIKRFCDYPALRTTVKNGITLCRTCHRTKTLNKEKQLEGLFFGILNSDF